MPLKKKYTKKSKKVKTRLVGGKRVKPNRRKLVRKSLKRKRVKGKKHRGGGNFEVIKYDNGNGKYLSVSSNIIVHLNKFLKSKINDNEINIKYNKIVSEQGEYINIQTINKQAINEQVDDLLNSNSNYILICYILKSGKISNNNLIMKEIYIIFEVNNNVDIFLKGLIDNNKRTFGITENYSINELELNKYYLELFNIELINYNKLVVRESNVSVKYKYSNIPNFKRIEFL